MILIQAVLLYLMNVKGRNKIRGLRGFSLTGFTLIEIMIVVAIVMILIGLLIPQILRSRIIGIETATIGNLKTLVNACQLYSIDNRTYPSQLTDLSDAIPRYADPLLASGTKQGYKFDYNLVNSEHFTIQASSLSSGLLKGRYFYADELGVIHYNAEAEAGPDDEIVK